MRRNWKILLVVCAFYYRRIKKDENQGKKGLLFIYYESTNRKLKTKYICGCRCYERLHPNTKEFTCLSYTELVLELEHLKIETRLITEMLANVMGECEN